VLVVGRLLLVVWKRGTQMQRTGFEKLKVYQLSEVLSDRLWECVCEWGHLAQRTVGEQLIRAADSVGANIAEGYGRGTCNDNRRFVRIARGSLYETKHFLRRAYRRKLIADEDVDAIKVLI